MPDVEYGTDTHSPSRDRPPVAIGGIGGSGTRLIVQIIEKLGYHIGNDLNKSKDNLLFTLLFRRKNILLEEPATIDRSCDLLINNLRGDHALDDTETSFIIALAKGDRHGVPESWFAQRITEALRQPVQPRRSMIAWKEPNTHVILDKLLRHKSHVRYIHVVRDGLDMAFSDNQNQLLLWGDCYLNRPVSKSPSDALRYWNAVHYRLLDLKAQYLNRILIISFDRICQCNGDELQHLFRFVDIQPDAHKREEIDALIRPPKTLGRANNQDMGQFDAEILRQYHQITRSMNEAA